MPDEGRNVKIRVRSGDSEAEVEAPLSEIHDAIALIPLVLAKLPQARPSSQSAVSVSDAGISQTRDELPSPSVSSAPTAMPMVTIEKGDSLSEVISKFFADPWGRNPRKLNEVREALSSYGLNYPKQSVAVALLRLAKGSKIRRFKAEGGEYVYTASTGAARLPVQIQPTGVQHPPEEPVHAGGPVEEPEEALNLDAPASN